MGILKRISDLLDKTPIGHDKDSFDKGRYFADATEEEIGHEFRKLVIGLDTKKVEQFMRSHKKFKGCDIDPDIANPKGMTGMWYMNHLMEKEGKKDADMAKRIENMTLFLYEKGAKLTDKKGKSLFSEASIFILGKLLPKMEKKNDREGLKVVDQIAKKILGNADPTKWVGPIPSNIVQRAVKQERVAKVRRALENPSPSGRIGPIDAKALYNVLESSRK